MSNPFFAQVKSNIIHLLSEKKFSEAYSKCNEILNKYPDNKDFYDLKERIESEVEKRNLQALEDKLKELKSLWKEEKFTEIIAELRNLRKTMPNNKKLENELKKAQEAYREQVLKLQKKFLKKQRENLEEILRTSPEKLPKVLFQLQKNNLENKEILSLTKEYQEKIIDKKLSEKSQLLGSEKFRDIEHLIEDLKKIDPTSDKLKKLEQKLRSEKVSKQGEEKKEYVYKGKQNLETLIKLHKYDKAIKAAEEILEVNPQDSSTKKALEKAKSLYYIQTRDLTIKEIDQEKQNLKNSYKKNKEDFIRI